MTEAWLHLQGFFDILFTRNVLTEIAALVVCLAWVGRRPSCCAVTSSSAG